MRTLQILTAAWLIGVWASAPAAAVLQSGEEPEDTVTLDYGSESTALIAAQEYRTAAPAPRAKPVPPGKIRLRFVPKNPPVPADPPKPPPEEDPYAFGEIKKEHPLASDPVTKKVKADLPSYVYRPGYVASPGRRVRSVSTGQVVSDN